MTKGQPPEATTTRARTPAELHAVARTPEDWQAVLAELGERSFHAKQVFRWIQARGVTDPENMTDLSKALRAKLTEQGVSDPARVVSVHRAADGTRKLLLELADGARIECVLIPMTKDASAPDGDADVAAASDTEDEEGPAEIARDGGRQRVTLCISTQHGCAMGCVFCASGQAGLQRGLVAAEIVAQILIARRHLEPSEYLRNLVFMGMGEPLHHYDETARALRLITHPDGIAMSPRRITVSTVGLVPGIARLGADFGGKIGLAVSLHAPDDETRNRIVPMNKRYPVADLLLALRRYPLPARRRITIEYTLIAGENDSPAHADRLATVLRGLRVKVNLIPMNSIERSSLHAAASRQVDEFRRVLVERGLSCFVRTRRGDDVSAACGQLALSSNLVRDPA